MAQVGALVRERRTQANWSQDKLASKAAISRGHVANIENGLGSPTLDSLDRIADALGFELHITFRRKRR